MGGLSLISDPRSGYERQLQNGYFKQNITATKSGLIFKFTGEKGEKIEHTIGNTINSFSFSNSAPFSEESETLDIMDYAGSTFDENSNNSGFWYKFSLGDADIYNGIHYCAEKCTNNESDFGIYAYAFSNKVLEYNDLVNVSQVLGNKEYTYSLISNRFDFEGLEPISNMKVNFGNKNIEFNLQSTDHIDLVFIGHGSFNDFYNGIIHLNAEGNNIEGQGSISGRFIGSNAEGAITTYLLSTGNDSQNGIAVFKREGVEVGP